MDGGAPYNDATRRVLVDYGPPRPVPPFVPQARWSGPTPGDNGRVAEAFGPADPFEIRGAGFSGVWNEDVVAATRSPAEGGVADWRSELLLRHDLARLGGGWAPATLGGGVKDRIEAAARHPFRYDPFFQLDSTDEWTQRLTRWEDRVRQGDRPLPTGATRFADPTARAYGQEELSAGLS